MMCQVEGPRFGEQDTGGAVALDEGLRGELFQTLTLGPAPSLYPEEVHTCSTAPAGFLSAPWRSVPGLLAR